MSLLDPQLQAFMAIAEHQSVHGAAEALFVTQTAITQRLKKLEQKLKVSLFVRSRRGMLLTEEGGQLLRYCQASNALASNMLGNITKLGTETTVSLAIGGPTSVMQGRVLPQVSQLMNDYPAVLYELFYHDNEQLVQLLKEGKLQLAILAEEQVTKEMNSQNLQPEEYILVACKDWKSRKLKSIIQQERIIDFRANDQMTFNYLKQYQLFEQANHERYFANHPEAIAKLVMAGNGYTVLEKSFAEPLLNSGELIALNRAKAYLNPIALAWFDRPEMPGYFEDLISAIN